MSIDVRCVHLFFALNGSFALAFGVDRENERFLHANTRQAFSVFLGVCMRTMLWGTFSKRPNKWAYIWITLEKPNAKTFKKVQHMHTSKKETPINRSIFAANRNQFQHVSHITKQCLFRCYHSQLRHTVKCICKWLKLHEIPKCLQKFIG